jgi:hypothetical protein
VLADEGNENGRLERFPREAIFGGADKGDDLISTGTDRDYEAAVRQQLVDERYGDLRRCRSDDNRCKRRFV